MTEFCSISIVGFGALAITLHLSALLKPRRSRRRPLNCYLPPASRPLTMPKESSFSTTTPGNRQ